MDHRLSNAIRLLKIFKHFFLFSLKLLSENRLVKSINLLLFNIKSTNPIQKYPLIIELHN